MWLGQAYGSFKARPRLLVAAAVIAAVAVFLPGTLRPSTRFLIGWDCGIGLYLVLVFIMMGVSDTDAMQRRADDEDAGAAAVLALTVAAAIVSLGAIGAELRGLHEAGTGAASGGRLALAAGTILMSWIFVHIMFTLHYSHDYYAGEDDRRGLNFPNDDAPDYWDFAYFAFTMGAASQTSDVSVTAKRMRRFVLAHTIVSFLFNTTVLALAINVGASLL